VVDDPHLVDADADTPEYMGSRAFALIPFAVPR
jgi:hypothetical protein